MQGVRNCGLEGCKVAKLLRLCVVADLVEIDKESSKSGASKMRALR